MRSTYLGFAVCAVLTVLLLGGCSIDLQLDSSGSDAHVEPNSASATTDSGVTGLENAAGTLQTTDPRAVELPALLIDNGDTIVIDQGVNVIVNINQDLIVTELPNRTVLGFDNQSGYDIYIRYLVDGNFQSVYVYDGDTLLLEYPCLEAIELLSEDDIDSASGLLIDSFELGELYLNPDDFICGDAVILPFEPATVEITVEYIDLLIE